MRSWSRYDAGSFLRLRVGWLLGLVHVCVVITRAATAFSRCGVSGNFTGEVAGGGGLPGCRVFVVDCDANITTAGEVCCEREDSPREAGVEECGVDCERAGDAVMEFFAVVETFGEEVDYWEVAFRYKGERFGVEEGVEVLPEAETVGEVAGYVLLG